MGTHRHATGQPEVLVAGHTRRAAHPAAVGPAAHLLALQRTAGNQVVAVQLARGKRFKGYLGSASAKDPITTVTMRGNLTLPNGTTHAVDAEQESGLGYGDSTWLRERTGAHGARQVNDAEAVALEKLVDDLYRGAPGPAMSTPAFLTWATGVSGTLTLLVNRGPCTVCRGVIKGFCAIFPAVTVTVTYRAEAMLMPSPFKGITYGFGNATKAGNGVWLWQS